MASAFQTIKCIRDEIPLRTRILSLNTIVLSHLHYPCMLLNGCTEENLDKLGKQTKWGIRIVMKINRRDSVINVREKQTIPTAARYIKYRSKVKPKTKLEPLISGSFRILISALIIAPAQFSCQDCVKPIFFIGHSFLHQ